MERQTLNPITSDMVIPLLTLQTQMKLYHWQTTQYSRHKASDYFLEKFSQKMDKFVESLQGSGDGGRVYLEEKKNLIALTNLPLPEHAEEYLKLYREWIQHELSQAIQSNSALLNLRDEMLMIIDKTLYLFSLD